MKIVLYQPQIPQNTGNIVRTCSLTQTSLLLVKPTGFSTRSRQLKRAGLDYWNEVDIEETEDLFGDLQKTEHPFFFFSSHARQLYTQAIYPSNSLLIFGSETAGLPSCFWERWPEHFYTIPMAPQGGRCLNLANSAAIVLYEALRQNHFEGLNKTDKRMEKTTLINREEVKGT